MGHSRIGTLPATRRWKEVVQLIADGADVSKVAEATLKAAELAFAWVQEDVGFREAANLMVQIAQTTKDQNPTAALAKLGIEISENTSVAEVAMAVGEALDQRVNAQRGRSDFGEMAGKALVSAVIGQIKDKLPTLFEPTRDDIAGALRSAGQEKGFGEFASHFFSRVTGDSLDYFLSKTLATKLGEGQRFATNNQMAEFMGAMRTLCKETAVISKEYAGGWLSKHRFEEGGNISRETIGGFAWYGMQKMRAELAMRAIEHEH
ncbi:MAG: hypothetical protein WCO56_24425 [Verrucomicrobiota bacterium]